MEGLILGVSGPFLLFGLGCIIMRICNGPPSGNASRKIQWGGVDDDFRRYRPHYADPPELFVPTVITDPYHPMYTHRHGPGPGPWGPGPGLWEERVHKLSKTRRDETQCGFLIERWFFARYWAAKIPSTPKGFG